MDAEEFPRLTTFKVYVILVMLTVAAGCSAPESKLQTPLPAVASSNQLPSEYRIQPGDQLEIKSFYHPEINETVLVRPDGYIALLLIDDIKAAGKTPAELDDFLSEAYAREIKSPELTVIVRQFAIQQVYVGGEIQNPGLVPLTTGMTPLMAIFRAGGLKNTADLKETILIRRGPKSKPIPERMNLQDALYGKGPGAGTVLQPQDIIYVPKSAIAKVNLFVN